MPHQNITFNASALVDLRWEDMKAVLSKKSLRHQSSENEDTLTVFAVDGPILYSTLFIKTPASDSYPFGESYTKANNDADLADYEANYKASENNVLDFRTSDGRLTVRDSTANRTSNFKLRVFSFKTAAAGSVHNVNPVTDADYGDAAISFFDVSGAPCAEADAVKTVVDWEPHYNYEIIGGYMDVPSAIKDGTSDAWYLSVIGVPDYPPEMFGSVDYISEVNLEAVSTQKIISNGRAVSYMPYNYGGAPHTNRLRFIVKHPKGAQQRFQVYIEHFS
jgi:hypothetical protein